MSVKSRIEKLEHAAGGRVAAWQIKTYEYEPGQFEATAAAVRECATAAGWVPGSGPYGIFIPKTRKLSDVHFPLNMMPMD